MTDKVITCATKQAADDLKTAIFKKYRADQLVLRGALELDRYRGSGLPLPVQVTTQYVDAPPPKYADPLNPTTKEQSDYAAAKQVQVTVDATVDAMQGVVVDIGAGKLVTIDVSAATAQLAQAQADESVKG